MKILILVDYSTEFSRCLLKGLIRYAQEVGECSFYRIPPYYKYLYGEEGVVKFVHSWKAEAVIAEWNYLKVELLKKLDIPVFLQNYKEEGKCFSNITGDYIGTGTMAAKFFIERGYKNFAFYGNKGFIWSTERAEGFRREVELIQGNYFYFESENNNTVNWKHSHVELEDWLISLPKPIAVFACDDSFALQIAEMCKLNNIDIPKEIALLGVDDDELICNLSDPPISSIVLNAEAAGYELGRNFHESIIEKKSKPFNICVNPIRIKLRASTENYNTTDKHILEVIKYIQHHFDTDIKIDSLTELVPLSRRSLEMKFKSELGISIYQFIINIRIEHFTTLLLTTDKDMIDIVIESGFNDYSNVFRIFKRLKNCTPYQYRERFAL